MNKIKIKKKKIIEVYEDESLIEFFESGQKLCISDRNCGVTRSVIFELTIKNWSPLIELEIKYSYYYSDGSCGHGDFYLPLVDFINNTVDINRVTSEGNRYIFMEIKQTVLKFLAREKRNIDMYFIMDSQRIKKIVEESIYNSKLKYEKMFNLHSRVPLYDFYHTYILNILHSTDVIYNYDDNSILYKGEYFESDEVLLKFIYGDLNDFSINDIRELIKNMIDEERYNGILELGNLIEMVENEDYVISYRDLIVLNELKKPQPIVNMLW